MNISGPTATNIATKTWAAATRTITSLSGAITTAGLNQVSLAASTNVIIVNGAGIAAFGSFAGVAGAAGTLQIGLDDSSQGFTLLSIVAGATGSVPCVAMGNVMAVIIINNDAVNAAKYSYQLIRIN